MPLIISLLKLLTYFTLSEIPSFSSKNSEKYITKYYQNIVLVNLNYHKFQYI